MPYKKTNRKQRKGRARKGYKKRNWKKNAPTTTIMKSPGFSDSMYCKLKYAEEVHLYDTVGSVKIYTYRGNSLFDPNYTGTGHQPMYFDQYSAIYERYRVLGCKIKVHMVNRSATSAAYAVLESGTDVSSILVLSELLEQSRAHVSRILPTGNQSPVVIKKYVSTRKACGLNKKQVFDEDFSALTTANPQQIWYHNIQLSNADPNVGMDIRLLFTLTYYCQFFDRKLAPQS